MEKLLGELYEANIELDKAILSVHNSIEVYGIFSLNAERIRKGRTFFGFIQQQQVEFIAIGFSKIFEREKSYRLNSIPSILRFIQGNSMVPTDPHAVTEYLDQWKNRKSEPWIDAVKRKCNHQYSKHKIEIERIREARNTHFAHLQAETSRKDLPSVAVFQELLAFAFGFYDFINAAFFTMHSHRVLTDTRTQTSLVDLLHAIGVSEVITVWPD